MYIQEFHKNMGPRTNWAIEAYMPSWVKEKRSSGLDFTGDIGNLQVDKKEQTCGEQFLDKQILAEPTRKQWNTEKSLTNRIGSSLSATLTTFNYNYCGRKRGFYGK